MCLFADDAPVRLARAYPACPARLGHRLAAEPLLSLAELARAAATLHELGPGDAVFVPYGAPHWVKAGPEPSISLSLTWQNAWSERVADALALNPLMRRIGLGECDPAHSRDVPRWRALAGRAARKAGMR